MNLDNIISDELNEKIEEAPEVIEEVKEEVAEEVKEEVKEEPKEEEKEDFDALLAELKADPFADIADDWEPTNYKELLVKATDAAVSRIEAKQKEQEIESKKTNQNLEQIKQEFDAEIDGLVTDGKIPPIVDRENPEDEGVKKATEIYKFMIERNKQLEKDGKRYRINSPQQAFTIMEAELITKNDLELKKKRGSMIGTGSGLRDSAKPSYVRGQTLDDIMGEVIG